MRKMVEEKRKILQDLNSDSDEGPENKRRRVSKSKTGKDIKSSKKGKGKKSDEIDTEQYQGKNKTHKTDRNKKVRKESYSDSLDSSSIESNSSSDEFTKAVKNIQRKRSRKQKSQTRFKHLSSVGKKSKHHRCNASSDSEDSSVDSSSSDASTSSDESSGSSGRIKYKHKKSDRKHKKGKPIKSGVKAKAHKIRLKTSELCAQAMLDEEYCPGTHTLDSLSFDKLVAGELEICTRKGILKNEKTARLKILKLLAYYAHWLSQSTLIDVYKAIILKIEKGIFSWSSEVVEKAENMLDRSVSKNKIHKEGDPQKDHKNLERLDKTKDKLKKEPGIQLKNGDRIIYCADFNRNKCDKQSSHEGTFGGKEVTKFHVCKTCLTTDKEKRFHPENDDNCPNKLA